ncbi:MAG TPA: amidohydrolase family protein [Rhodospirillales bacterium]|nr:amidohydrolase family protein [Rhodospirillales bacterium]
MKIAIVNLDKIATGDWRDPLADGDTVVMEEGKFTRVGTASADDLKGCDLVLDAGGMSAFPGLIDSQVHITFGDYTPRQKTVGYLESYLHGGTTTSISASEVHVPGRPGDPEGVKALAVTAMKCFETYRPGGMRVHAGAVILEPGLTQADFKEIADKGVWLAKAGFGAVESPYEYTPMVRAAQSVGMIVNVHTGGASILGSSAITGDHLLDMMPDVSFHVNGGPVAMPDADFQRVIDESEIALQVCQAGNIRTAVMCLNLAVEADAFDRFLIATDTPTGTGVMPCGMMKSMCEMASLTDHPAEWMVAAATGNVAEVYRLETGFIREGKEADIIVVDAALGGTQDDALSSIKHGDYFSIAGCFTAGEPRFIGKSRNTPPSKRKVEIVHNNIPNPFTPASHL